jgi:cytochrome c
MIGLLTLSLVQLAHADIDRAKAEKLAQEKGCTACHGIDKKVIGPAYKGAEVQGQQRCARPARQEGQGRRFGGMGADPDAPERRQGERRRNQAAGRVGAGVVMTACRG